MKNNNYFFGWTNIKWFITEIGKIYSGQESYFSKKRIESGVAFIIAQWAMVLFFITHLQTLTMGEFLLWATAEFAVSGYIINQIQKEKILNQPEKSEENPQQLND